MRLAQTRGTARHAALAALLLLTLFLLGAAAPAGATIGFTAAPGSPYPVGGADFTLGAVDLNGDGRSDLLYSTPAGVGAMLASPLGALSPFPGAPAETPSQPVALVSGDLNGDGIPDAVAVTSQGKATVLLGNGAGGFAPAPESPLEVGAQASPTSVAIGDFNGDGHPDLAFADCGAGGSCSGSGETRVSVFLGDGSGHFAEAPDSPFAAGLTATGPLAVADLDHDGGEDLVVGGKGQVAVLLGDGKGGFQPAAGSPFSTGVSESALDLAVGDLNGDGRQDVVTANGAKHTISVLLGDGRGQLTAEGTPLPTGSLGTAQSVAIADLDANGTPDLVVADSRSPPAEGEVSILPGDGLGDFEPASLSPLPAGGSAFFGRIGDFNGDGQPDIALANGAQDSLSVLLNTNVAAAKPSSGELAFSRLDAGQTSAPESVTIANSGDGFLRMQPARLAGVEAGDFTISSDGCGARVLLVGQSCSLGVSFHPSAGGTRAATLEVPDNVSGGATTVAVAGTGLATPILSSVRFSPSRFAVLLPNRLYPARGPHRGSKLLLTLSEPATVRVSVSRTTIGHRRGGKCFARGHGRRCTRIVAAGHFNVRLGPGEKTVTFRGVLADRALHAGTYTATIMAINDESLSSGSVKLRFQILR
jgi:FG-GAP-like repeat